MGASSSAGSYRTQRALEVATGSLTWALLTAPLWGALLVPTQLVYFLVLFNVYWLYKTANMAISAVIGYRRLRAGQRVDWLGRARALDGWDRVRHLVMIPTYKEPPEILEVMLDHVAAQDFPGERIDVVLAFEERDTGARERAVRLVEQFDGRFGHLWVTYHPDRPGELRGKSSNLAFAVQHAERALVDELGHDREHIVVTVCDADSRLPAKFLSALTYNYLSNPLRRYRIWQPALLFYPNIWRLPTITRISAGLYSVWQLSRLVARYKLVTQSTYSLGLSTAHDVGYWDVDVIPEDSRMFFKVFFDLGHEHEVCVDPIFLPVMADAAEGKGFWATIGMHYRQTRRWAWGVSDVPYVVRRAATERAVPLWARVRRAAFYVEEHICWPTHWFILTLGANAVAYFAPATAQAQPMADLLRFSGWMLTACIPALLVVATLDRLLRPPRPVSMGVWSEVAGVAAWFLLPVVGLVLTALPAVDAHTRLLLGKYMHYQVTEKLPSERGLTAPQWTDSPSSAGAA